LEIGAGRRSLRLDEVRVEPLSYRIIKKYQLGKVVHVCNPSHSGGGDKRTAVQGHPGKSWRPYLKSKLTVKE
jgi:hypothetical protein